MDIHLNILDVHACLIAGKSLILKQLRLVTQAPEAVLIAGPQITDP